MIRFFGALLLMLALVGCGSSGGSTPTPAATTSASDDSGGDLPSEAPSDTSFEPVSLSGHGDKVAPFTIPLDAPAIATITNKGSGTFSVETLDDAGAPNDELVSVTGDYKGTRLFDTDAHSVSFRIRSSGDWTVKVAPVTDATAWNGTSALKGKGDSVIQIKPPISGFVTALVKHTGTGAFVITTVTPDGSDVTVNEVGKVSVQAQFPDGTTMLGIEADGAWSITPGS